MRFLLKATMPTEPGNRSVLDGTLSSSLRAVMEDLKPEAAYFIEEDGYRTALFIIHMEHASQIPSVAEPFFLTMNARVHLHPVMTAEDLAKSGLEDLAKKWGRPARNSA